MAATTPTTNGPNGSIVCTVDGTRLKYDLNVLQQPQRARACGAGAKSSADRRPVDPPPVVELKIFDEETNKDVTFAHNANFFLYTTLESARHILPARGSTTSAPPPPTVLTGTPVAGMAYLDRPSPAGYFIFPDLSVRHEGVYRLIFHLYEQSKGRDACAEGALCGTEATGIGQAQGSSATPNDSFTFRLEIRSDTFTVYSAKKFPGLEESTTLSRLVAEQGCRVRIRRDVRMRRRETKPTKEHEELDEEPAAYAPTDRYCTPDAYAQQGAAVRARSASAPNVDPAPYPLTERRPSLHDGNYYHQQPYQQPAVAPMLQPAPNNANTHLTFGNAPSGGQCQTPVIPMNGPAANQQSMPYNANPAGYQTPQGLSHARQMSAGSDYAYHPQAYPQPQYGPPQPYYDAPEYKSAGRQPSSNQSMGPSRDAAVYPTVDSRINAGPQGYYIPSPVSADPPSATATGVQHLPPLKAVQSAPERKFDAVTTPIAMSETAGVGAHVQAFDPHGNYPPFASNNQQPPPGSGGGGGGFFRPGKRSYGKVFDTEHLSQPVHHGARPEATGQDVPQVECDEGLTDEVDINNLRMLTYRRADGSRANKKIPSPVC